MAITRGAISLGRSPSGSRTEVAAGPIAAAILDISVIGFSPLRIASMAVASVIPPKSGIAQAISLTNSDIRESGIASLSAAVATVIQSGPAALAAARLSP